MEEQFFIPQGLWFVVDPDTFQLEPKSGRIVPKDTFTIAALKHKGQIAVVALTDEDLADRYVKALGDPSMVKVRANHDGILEVLLNCQAQSYTHVAFDPMPKGIFIPIGAVIEGIEKGPA